MRTKSISRNKNIQPAKGFFFKRNPQRQHSFFESTVSNRFFGGGSDTIYRKCDECSKEEQVHRKTDHATATSHAPANPHTYLNKLDGFGQSLPKDQQQFFGQRMNYDFEEVKIHTDKDASDSAASLNAQAYTHKNHIVFNENRYQPTTIEGRKLLSHELAHVIQQSDGLISRQHHPGAPPLPTYVPIDPEVIRREQIQLTRELTPFIERRDAPDLLRRLRALNFTQATRLMDSEDFTALLYAHFRGTALWSIFSVLFSRGNPDGLITRLSVAIMDRNAQMTVDLLGLYRNSLSWLEGQRPIMRTVLPQIFGGNARLPEMLELLQEGTIPARQVSFRTNRVHYERDEHGQMALRHFGAERRLDYRTTATQMRVVVPLDFVEPGPDSLQFYFLGGALPSILDNWLNTITRVWNNQFYLWNGRQALLLVFVPIAVHAGRNQIEVHTNATDTCPGSSDRGRAQGNCFFTFNTGNTVAHEFGHLIGAGDEYNLPATAAEIPASVRSESPGMSVQDIRESNVEDINASEGISNPRLPAVAGGHDMPDSLMSDHEASQHVYARHILRLVNEINAQLPAGVPEYRIGRPASASV